MPIKRSNIFKIALLQTKVFLNKFRTLEHVQDCLEEAITNGAKVCVLPECFNSLYRRDRLLENAEDFSDPITKTPSLNLIRDYARKYEVYILGSLPEKSTIFGSFNKPSSAFGSSFGSTLFPMRLYNTGFAFDPTGEMIAKHRKVHLFDIDIPNKITYKESETFKSGSSITVFPTIFCQMGLGVCYDLRFPELAILMRGMGAKVLCYPGAFNTVTGPLHWELLLRGRAVDNQTYVIGCSPARYDEDQSYYQAWGHSIIVDPMGKVLAQATGHESDIVYGEINLDFLEEVRKELPYLNQRRLDMYQLFYKKGEPY